MRPALGKAKLSKLSFFEVQKLYNAMQNQGLSARTIRYTHAVLSSALKYAVKCRIIHQNPAGLVELPRQVRKEMRAMSPDEVQRFLAAAEEDKWGVLFNLAIVTGMRPGEYLGLQWRDIDFYSRKATIQRALVQGQNGLTFQEPKTPKSRRTIPLTDSLIQALKAHKQRQAEERMAHGPGYESQDLVFAAVNGRPPEEHNLVHRHFKPLLKAADLPPTIRLYDLRHTCATLMLAAGINVKVISERLGHASITLTLDTYSHVLPDMQREATDLLEAVMLGVR